MRLFSGIALVVVGIIGYIYAAIKLGTWLYSVDVLLGESFVVGIISVFILTFAIKLLGKD